MEFRTPIHIPASPIRLGLQSRILTVGSCFADVMGSRMQENKWQVLANPFGTIFNPVSLANVLMLALGKKKVPGDRLVQANGLWYHYDFHSAMAAVSPEALLTNIDQTIRHTGEFLRSSDCLILTLGTSVAYRLQKDQQIVANCHKVPAEAFQHTLLSLPEVLHPLEVLLKALLQHKPDLKIILTVSPVRHTKDTLQLNSVSKALLRVACHQLAARFDAVEYFPAYEILMDDLRDYRFYKPDMIHPTEVAEEYIWQQFMNTYADENTHRFVQQWSKIRQALAHRPMQENSPAHQKFLQALEQKLLSLAPVVDVTDELAEVRNRMRCFNV